jgi:hypothetical protein
VLLHSFFYFILSILSNDQNVAKPVYWTGVVETWVVRAGELIKRNRKQWKLLFRRMKSISALSATPYSLPVLFAFTISSDLSDLVFFSSWFWQNILEYLSDPNNTWYAFYNHTCIFILRVCLFLRYQNRIAIFIWCIMPEICNASSIGNMLT